MQQTGIPATDDVREVFREVLSGPDFQYAGTSPLVNGIRAIIRWIQDLIRGWFPGLGEPGARLLSWIVLGLGVLFLVSLLVRRVRDRTPRRATDRRGIAPSPEPRDAAGWMAWARSAARDGRLRDAATGVYQATILTLDAHGALRYREWKTPGDYALEVSPAEVRDPFKDFLGRFLEIAFGPAEPTAEAFEALSARAKRLGGSL